MLLICLILLISCEKEKIYQEKYKIGVQNNYFETIDSVKIGTNMILTPISVGEKQFFREPFTVSNYTAYCYTQSNLVIKADFKAISHQDIILLIINSEGKISIK